MSASAMHGGDNKWLDARPSRMRLVLLQFLHMTTMCYNMGMFIFSTRHQAINYRKLQVLTMTFFIVIGSIPGKLES